MLGKAVDNHVDDISVGTEVGGSVGSSKGMANRIEVGWSDGTLLRRCDGMGLGRKLGVSVGAEVWAIFGSALGASERKGRANVGAAEGGAVEAALAGLGWELGAGDGGVGALEGSAAVGGEDGFALGV